MSANVKKNGVVVVLDKPAEPDEQVTEEQAKSPPMLVQLLMRVLRQLAGVLRWWRPRRIDFEDREVDASGTTKYRFPHGFGGRVRWWPVDWESSDASGPQLKKHADTTDKVLVLVSEIEGTVTVRVEEAG